MKINVKCMGRGETFAFAKEELCRCLLAMDPTTVFAPNGMEICLSVKEDSEAHDHIEIHFCGAAGSVTGSTPCALLIAVYRLLQELGCRWTVMGREGEHIPSRKLTEADFCQDLEETASYKIRAVCIEGSVSEENVRDMIDFLPKIGMNAYFIQFHVPTYFFKHWYAHENNPYLEPEDCGEERVKKIVARLETEMEKRGIQYHAIGHGWTCVPFGLPNDGWTVFDGELPDGYFEMTAMIDGKRGLRDGMPVNTNLCYSNDSARKKIISGFVEYCRLHPNVDVVYFNLADNFNSFCECENCRKQTPADWYVQMLNEIDDELTRQNIPTRIIFELYQETLWTPEVQTLHQTDRFILSFAPISRTYSHALLDENTEWGTTPHDAFELNRIRMPQNVDENLSFLREWQALHHGDCTCFDYHLMWDHCFDPGYMACAKIIYEDVRGLQTLKLDGYTSCQLTRAAFPTNLPQYVLGKTLWNRDADFDEVVKEYFEAEFGECGGDVCAYLKEITKRFDPIYLRGEVPAVDAERERMFRTIPEWIEQFRVAHPQMRHDSENLSWRTLDVHADVMVMLSMLLARKAAGLPRHDLADAIRTYLQANEMCIQTRLDVGNYIEKSQFLTLFKLES